MPHDNVISNTSPLFYLHQIGELELLRDLFDKILVPQAVYKELQAGKVKGLSIPDLEQHDWIEIRVLSNDSLLPAVVDLGRGEAEVIAFGLTLRDSLLILDDRLGRQIAAISKLRYTGVLGLLIQAKKVGLFSTVEPKLSALRSTTMRMSDDLMRYVLEECGEA